jgi:TonB family protein
MRFQWWLSVFLVIGSCLIGSPSRAQDAPERPKDLFGQSEFFLRKHLINSPKPEYPEPAKRAGIQGQVLVFVWFAKDGSLVEAKTLVSSDESLSKAAITALKEWRIKPFMPYNSEANQVSEVRFVFSLIDGKAEVSNAPEAEQKQVSEECNREIKRRWGKT